MTAFSPSYALPSDGLAFAQKVDLFAANQLFRLEQMVERRLHDLKKQEQSYLRLKAEVDAFVEEYYQRVWPYLPAQQKQEHASQPSPATDFKKLRKALYRSLVKQCHPDAAKRDSDIRFDTVQAAYEQGGTFALLEADWQQRKAKARALAEPERLQAMLSWFQELQQHAMQMQQLYTRLKQSDEAALMQRYLEARLTGHDWFGAHIRQLQKYSA